jgi:hypothetical protein
VIRDLELRTIFIEAGRIVYDTDVAKIPLSTDELESLYRELIWHRNMDSHFNS